MFSTVSGQYFSGHLATVTNTIIVVDPNLPLPNNLVVFYDMANSLSYTSGSTSVVSLTNIKNTATINGSNPYDDTAPKNMTSIEPASVKLDASTTATLDVGNIRTYSFWFKYTAPDTGVIRSTNLFTQYDPAAPLNYFRMGVYSISSQGGTLLTDFGFSTPGGSTGSLSIGQSAGSSITIGSWYMSTVVIDYSNSAYMVISFYINGVLQSTGSSQFLSSQYNPTGPTQTTEITMTTEVQPLWSKFMMWNTGLNVTQVAQLYNYQRVYYGAPAIPVAMPDPSHMILKYDIAQSGTQNPIPNVGNGGAASLTTSVTPTFQTTTAPMWASVNLLNVDSSVVTPSSVRLNTTSYRTISIWFYISANPTTQWSDIITNNNTVTNWDGIYIQLSGGGAVHFATNGGSVFRYYDHNSMPLNKWTFITMVYIVSATQPNYCYIDGQLVGQYLHGSDSVDPFVEHKVRVNAASGYGGKWSEVKLWDVGLTADQVMAEFTAKQSYYGA